MSSNQKLHVARPENPKQLKLLTFTSAMITLERCGFLYLLTCGTQKQELILGQEAGGFITGGLNEAAVERLQGRRHEVIPGGLIAGRGKWFQDDEVDLLLSAIGGGDKAVETAEFEKEIGQATAAGPDFDANEVEGHHQTV